VNEAIGVVNGELTRRNCNTHFTFTTWIVCYPPTMKNFELARLDHVLGLVLGILVD